ncbi:unnamed protein product [Ixodes pacificus]
MNENAEKNTRYQNHMSSSFGIYVVGTYNSIKVPLYVYRSKNTANFSCEKITNIAKEIHKLIGINKEMIPLNKKEREIHNNAHECYICLQLFKDNKVYDHDHWNEKYRGPNCKVVM